VRKNYIKEQNDFYEMFLSLTRLPFAFYWPLLLVLQCCKARHLRKVVVNCKAWSWEQENSCIYRIQQSGESSKEASTKVMWSAEHLVIIAFFISSFFSPYLEVLFYCLLLWTYPEISYERTLFDLLYGIALNLSNRTCLI